MPMSLIIYSGKTWYYRALQCSLNCVVVVLIPLVPLLEVAVQGEIDAGLRAVLALTEVAEEVVVEVEAEIVAEMEKIRQI